MDQPTYDIREINADIQEWLARVYPERTLDQIVDKLNEEIGELQQRPLDGWEIADVMILLLDLCDTAGFDLAKLVKHKMDTNRRRSWEIKDGVLKHVKHL